MKKRKKKMYVQIGQDYCPNCYHAIPIPFTKGLSLDCPHCNIKLESRMGRK